MLPIPTGCPNLPLSKDNPVLPYALAVAGSQARRWCSLGVQAQLLDMPRLRRSCYFSHRDQGKGWRRRDAGSPRSGGPRRDARLD